MSTHPTSVPRAATIHEVSAALRRGDAQGAEILFSHGAFAPAAIVAAANLAMQQRRWADAAWMFERVSDRDVSSGIKLCLCKNLAALLQHRTEIYDLLVALPKNDACTIGASATGHPTIVCRQNGQNVALSPGNHPIAALAGAMKQLTAVLESGQAFALCGVGDGYLLHQLAHKPPKLFMDTQQCIFLLEPDAHVLLTALMIHDYTGADGPIEQARFHWFAGPDWAEKARATLARDLFLPSPRISLMLGLGHAQTQATLNDILREMMTRDTKFRESVEQYYGTIDQAELAAVYGENPPRRPRVLLLTTRFSTVLQFATRDAAVGFQQAGWETRVLIEPTPHHRIMTLAMRSVLDEFKPDLVFQIDHQRQEHPGIFPSQLPFVCWIQDHMAHLMTTRAGEKVGSTDFVLTDAGPIYVHNYGYPSRQMISVAKLTAPPRLLPRPASRGDDLVFISNASGTPESLLEIVLKKTTGSDIDPGFVTDAVRRMVELHVAGDSLCTYPDVRAFLRDFVAERGLELTEKQFDELATLSTHPLCDALYRQQALRWAADAAKESGLKLALYGNGWDQHPEFSAFARGYVAPGKDLHELTRRSTINLQIVPYLSLHQRLLDGICSGAFYLVRKHISDVAPQAMLDLLETQCGSHIRRLNEARACVPPPVRDRFETLVKDCMRCLCSSGKEDPIEMVRAWQEAQLIEAGAGVLPDLDAVGFSDATSLKQRITQYVDDADSREQIVARQRASIVQRLTYPAAMAQVARRIGKLLSEESSQIFVGIPINIDIGCAA